MTPKKQEALKRLCSYATNFQGRNKHKLTHDKFQFVGSGCYILHNINLNAIYLTHFVMLRNLRSSVPDLRHRYGSTSAAAGMYHRNGQYIGFLFRQKILNLVMDNNLHVHPLFFLFNRYWLTLTAINNLKVRKKDMKANLPYPFCLLITFCFIHLRDVFKLLIFLFQIIRLIVRI